MGKDKNAAGKTEADGEKFDVLRAKPLDNDFLTGLAAHLARTPFERNVLLNIPIWGWTGHGKTCALLTAVHFCATPDYPLSLSLISDATELAEVELKTEAYKGMDLASVAAATTTRLRALSKSFIDDCEWPPGTDEPSNYVLAVRGLKSTLCYAIFPDLRGGSFREPDDASRAVLDSAHACILLVDPDLYQEKSTEGKRYRDEVSGRLQRLAEAALPFCVMISKSDRHHDRHGATDKTNETLSMLVERLSTSATAIVRVSVIGDKPTAVDAPPPRASERAPDALVRAWVWTVTQALLTPVDQLRERRPQMQLRSNSDSGERTDQKTLPELRRVGDYSEGPGHVLCATSDDEGHISFAFIAEPSELVQVVLPGPGMAGPTSKSIGDIDGWDGNADDAQADHRSGVLFFGHREKANALWQVSQMAQVRRTALPFEAAAWSLVTSQRLVAIDNAGRLSSLVLNGDKWLQHDFLENFIEASQTLRCVSLDFEPTVHASNGSTTCGVMLNEDGKFGARLDMKFPLQYDADTCDFSPSGLAAAVLRSGTLEVATSTKRFDLGPVGSCDAFPRGYALASRRRAIAWVTPARQLFSALIGPDGPVVTARAHAPTLSDKISGMAWTKQASLLVISYSDRTWNVFRPFGMNVR